MTDHQELSKVVYCKMNLSNYGIYIVPLKVTTQKRSQPRTRQNGRS